MWRSSKIFLKETLLEIYAKFHEPTKVWKKNSSRVATQMDVSQLSELIKWNSGKIFQSLLGGSLYGLQKFMNEQNFSNGN